MNMEKKLSELQNKVNISSTLIHCITNPVSINQCANIIIAAGARPIMAEHPEEVSEITAMSSALLINTGNITDVRMKSFRISAECANSLNIPIIIDIVGASCSRLRLGYIKNFLKDYNVSIIKGNMSEIKALLNLPHSSSGIDVGEADKIKESNLDESLKIAEILSEKYNTSVLVTGKYDIVTDGKRTYTVKNGSQYLGRLTGTGCMLGALAAVYMSFADPLESALLAAVKMGLAGENTEYRGPESFLGSILDNIYSQSSEFIIKNMNIEKYR